jgi:formylglycine-generating enzyme required for sulfatase activity
MRSVLLISVIAGAFSLQVAGVWAAPSDPSPQSFQRTASGNGLAIKAGLAAEHNGNPQGLGDLTRLMFTEGRLDNRPSIVRETYALLPVVQPAGTLVERTQQPPQRQPLKVVRDCESCPDLVLVPGGQFMMGSAIDEPGRRQSEGPLRAVNIGTFLMSIHPVTFADWDACVAAGGCDGFRPDDEGWGRDKRPVINVRWQNALSYVAWISRKTGKTYRLPSEAEWEYAARAGTTTSYYWGNEIGRNNANCLDCGSQWDSKQTATVGSFAPNAFGLHDMAGNVLQWTEDCWNYMYNGAPTDGRARLSGDCEIRVVRGGSWQSGFESLRSASRGWRVSTYRNRDIGFRIVRVAD